MIGMEFSTFTTAASSQINQESAEALCTALSQKYKEAFVAAKIGHRFNTDSVTFYVYPENKADLIFTAVMARDSGEVSDNYGEEKINHRVEAQLAEAFQKEGITAASRCRMVSVSPDKEKDRSDLSDTPPIDHCTVYLLLEKTNAAASKIIQVLAAMQKVLGIELLIAGYWLSLEAYTACCQILKSCPEISLAMIEEQEPAGHFRMTVQNGKSSLTAEELAYSGRRE